MPKQTVCLNMIVKNEAHVIEQTLECMLKYIDYYVISDTGSTDDTMNVIKNFFDKHNVKGEIHQNPWLEFGKSRTAALNLCRSKSDYIWVMDADDVIVGDLVLPEVMDKDSYTINIGKGFTYQRQQIFKNDPALNWRYWLSRHECPMCDKPNATQEHIRGDYYMDSRRLGARSNDPNKYLNDALALMKDYEEDPDCDRAVFYIAQSYYDHGDTTEAINWYRKRITMGRWYEEVFYSYYRIATGLEAMDAPWKEVKQAYLDAYNYCKERVEPLYQIAFRYRLNNQFAKAYKYAKLGSKIKFPEHCKLFIYRNMYDYKILDELAIDAYYIGNYLEAFMINRKLLTERANLIPDGDKARIQANLKFALEKLKDTEKANCIVYTGFNQVKYDVKFNQMLDDLSHCYNVYLAGNFVQSDKDNVYSMTVELLEKMKQSVKFSCVIMYDTVDLLRFKKEYSFLTSMITVLYLTEPVIKYVLENGVSVLLTNKHYVNSLLKNINLIVGSTENCVKQFTDKYQITGSVLTVADKLDLYNAVFNVQNINNKYSTEINNCKDVDSSSTDGFKLMLPEWKTTTSNKFYVQNMCLELINQSCKILKDVPNIQYYRYKQLSTIGVHVQALDCIENMLKSFKNSDYKSVLEIEKAAVLYESKQYNESYNLAITVLNRGLLPESLYKHAETVRDKNVVHLKDKYLVYPKARIDKIKNKTVHEIKVVFSITCCKRYDLFEQTINSFINCCTDFAKIDYWLLVDDNSSNEDREKMEKNYPFFHFIHKTPEEKGHWISMNKIRDLFLAKSKAQYLIHMEDDFHFVQKRNYVEDAITVLNDNPMYGQLLFNKNYSEVELSQRYIPGGIPKTVKSVRYLIHEHYKDNSPEYQQFLQRYQGYGTNGYWPHFSFRPSVIKRSVYEDVGVFSNTAHFERQYANEYDSLNYKSTFLDTFCCIHIGKKTWETNGVNSYKLNETDQFVLSDNPVQIKVVKTGDHEVWKRFKQQANKHLPPYEVVDLQKESANTVNTDVYKQIFLDNTFNSCLKVKGEYICHFNIWESLVASDVNSHCLVLYDTVNLNTGLNDNDIIHTVQHDLYFLTDDNKYKFTSYIISKSAVSSLLVDLMFASLSNDLNDMFNSESVTSSTNKLLSNIIYKEPHSCSYKQLEGFKFYSQLDSFGNDIKHEPKMSLEQLYEYSLKNPECVAFNTTGWLKRTVCDELDMVFLYNSTKECQGLYVKI